MASAGRRTTSSSSERNSSQDYFSRASHELEETESHDESRETTGLLGRSTPRGKMTKISAGLNGGMAINDEDRLHNDTLGKVKRPKRPHFGKRKSTFQQHEEALTIYEKKARLVNEEMDAMGMGRYQWYVWGLCGLGYLLDLLWAQAFGLVLSPLEQELGFGKAQSGNISTAFSAGLTAGAFVWGILVDIVGRRWAFNLTVVFSSVFGIGLGGANSYSTFLVLTAFVGFGVGGNIPIDTTITLEFLPQNRRWLLAGLSVFQPIGVVLCSGFAYAFIPFHSCSPNFSEDNPLPSCYNVAAGVPCCSKESNMGWRYLLFTLGGITIFVLICRVVLFRMQESPKYLIYRGQDAKAVAVIEKISKTNKRECGLTLEMLERLQQEDDSIQSNDSRKPVLGGGPGSLGKTYWEKFEVELARYGMLFSGWQMTRLTLLVWLTYIMDYWGFTVAGFYLPTILAIKNGALNVSLKATYRSYIYIYLPGVVGVAIGAMMYRLPFFGRKWTMVIASGLMGASIFIFSTVNDEATNIGINVLEYFFQSMFNAVLYGWTPEAFPAPIRGTACGVASFWGRLFGIVSPLIAAHLFAADGGGNVNSVLYLAGGVTLGCVVSTALLPNKSVHAESM